MCGSRDKYIKKYRLILFTHRNRKNKEDAGGREKRDRKHKCKHRLKALKVMCVWCVCVLCVCGVCVYVCVCVVCGVCECVLNFLYVFVFALLFVCLDFYHESRCCCPLRCQMTCPK